MYKRQLPNTLCLERVTISYTIIDGDRILRGRDVVALWAKPQKPVLQGQKTSSCKIESTRQSELPSLVPAPTNLAVRKHVNASRQIGTTSVGRKQRSVSKSHWPCDHGRLSLDKTLALWLEERDERRPLESNTTGQKLSRGTFTFNI